MKWLLTYTNHAQSLSRIFFAIAIPQSPAGRAASFWH